jgi:hypothetical protein
LEILQSGISSALIEIQPGVLDTFLLGGKEEKRERKKKRKKKCSSAPRWKKLDAAKS